MSRDTHADQSFVAALAKVRSTAYPPTNESAATQVVQRLPSEGSALADAPLRETGPAPAADPTGEWTREPPSVAGWYWDLARGPDQTARVEVVNAEYARALERRNAVLVEALREMPCPGPLDDNKDECAGWCVDHGDCGCAARPALAANGAPL